MKVSVLLCYSKIVSHSNSLFKFSFQYDNISFVGKTASINTNARVRYPCEALIVGAKGTIKVIQS